MVTIGDIGQLELGARVQGQFVTSSDRAIGLTAPKTDGFSFQRARVGITGTFLGRVEIQAERQLDDDRPWRDLFADVKVSRQMHVRAGHFKVPFSREQLTSMIDLDFTQRAAIVSDLVPLRSTGVLVHGQVIDRAVRYQVGVFEHTRQPRFTTRGPRLLSGRVTVSPLKKKGHRGAETLQLSTAWLRHDLQEGRTGPRGTLATGEMFFAPVYANGYRTLIGAGAVWQVPSVTLSSELMRVSDTRVGQALAGGDLSDFVSRGGYAAAAWHAVRRKGRRKGTSLVRTLDFSGRYDWVRFGSARTTDTPSWDPRADNVAPLAKRTLSLGATWQVNRHTALHTNVIREQLLDQLRLHPVGLDPRWAVVVRSQVVM